MRTIRRYVRVAIALFLLAPLLVLATPGTAQADDCPCTLFDNATPSVIDDGPDSGVKLATFFTASVHGYATGVRFYKAAANVGTHIGELYEYGGGTAFSLAQVTFTSESASGWQIAYFAKPVKLHPGATYGVTYVAPTGHYSRNSGFFGTPHTNGPLSAVSPSGGGYTYDITPGPNHFPNNVNSTNYWVDVVFETTTQMTSLFDMTYDPPATPAPPTDNASHEVGTRFTSDINTTVHGVRFWANTGWYKPPTANLWKADGTLLATKEDPDKDQHSGWYELRFDTPVIISANTEYVVSFFAVDGGVDLSYGYTSNFFTTPYSQGDFDAPVNAGVHVQTGASAFPANQSSTNYWVDPLFSNDAVIDVSADVHPLFTFATAGANSTCNGEPDFDPAAGSATAIALGRLAPSTSVSGGQELSITSNSPNGFAVYVRGTHPSLNLRSGGHQWADVDGTYGSADPLDAGEQAGYTYLDSTPSSSVANPLSATFIALDGTDREIMGSASSSSGDACLSFTAQSDVSTPAGTYTATLLYTAVPRF